MMLGHAAIYVVAIVLVTLYTSSCVIVHVCALPLTAGLVYIKLKSSSGREMADTCSIS